MFTTRKRICSKLAAMLGLGLWTSAVDEARSQEFPRTYFNKPYFQLPLVMDEQTRGQLSEVHLYGKESSSANWLLLQRGSPMQQGFNLQPEKEGEYLFTMVMVDKAGRMFPPSPQQLTPSLAVIVDWKGPQIEAYLGDSTADGQVVQVEARDVHVDPSKTQFFIQTRDQQWRPLESLPQFPQRFFIPAQAAITGMIRVNAFDLAGNSSRRDFCLSALTMLPPAGMVPAAAMPLSASEDMAMPVGGLEKITQNVAKTPAPKGAAEHLETPIEFVAQKPASFGPAFPPGPIRHLENPPKVDGAPRPLFNPPTNVRPPFDSQAPIQDFRPRNLGQVLNSYSGKREAAPSSRRLINHRQLVLEYQVDQVGASGVGKVEVWLTSDQGQSWHNLGEDPDCKSPVAIELPGEGVYGIAVSVCNGRGFGGTPPAPGDTPDTWVEVDLTRPLAELISLRPGSGEDAGHVVITWKAQDRNLPADGVDLYYAVHRESAWHPIAKGLKNTGRYCWMPPPNVGAAFLRLKARDQAGNDAVVETPQAFLLDDQSRPRFRLVSINPFSPITPPTQPEPGH